MGTALKEKQSKDLEVDDTNDNEQQEIANIEEVTDIINGSDLTQTQKIKVMQLVAKKEEYSGPIPHPEHLSQYERILPGSADRLIKMAENQASHRQNSEKKIIDFEIKNKSRGQIFGFILAVLGIFGGFVLVLCDKDVIGMSSLFGSVAILVGAFIYGKINDNKNS